MEFEKSRTWANLMSAFAGESQARTKYENYARKASEQGYEPVSYTHLDVYKRQVFGLPKDGGYSTIEGKDHQLVRVKRR